MTEDIMTTMELIFNKVDVSIMGTKHYRVLTFIFYKD